MGLIDKYYKPVQMSFSRMILKDILRDIRGGSISNLVCRKDFFYVPLPTVLYGTFRSLNILVYLGCFNFTSPEGKRQPIHTGYCVYELDPNLT